MVLILKTNTMTNEILQIGFVVEKYNRYIYIYNNCCQWLAN